MKFLKRHAYALLFTLFLMGANVYSLLKVFVIPSAVSTVSANTTSSSTSSSTASTSTGKVTKTDTTYKDDNMDIKITTGKTSDTTYYVADIQLSSADYLKTALAQNTYGTNITDTTSSNAQQNNAIFAINGDYYGANQSGYVIKNGQVYRDTDRNSDYEDLAVYSDGSFKTFKESDTTAQKLVDSGVVNTFAFGPTLVENGKVAVSENEEVGQAMADNPRTAIGVIEESDGSVHYIVIVSDGRTSESLGLTLYEMAELMKSYGVTTAYNLDGGGSSTMYFNGQVINKPILFTSVTKKSASKHFFTYIGLTIFSLVFTFVYERFSYGESSMFMRMMFFAPLAGALIYLLTGLGMSWVRNRASKLLFNSAIAVVASACLVKGIVEVSGRTTSVDMPYWYVAAGLLCLSIMTGFIRPRKLA